MTPSRYHDPGTEMISDSSRLEAMEAYARNLEERLDAAQADAWHEHLRVRRMRTHIAYTPDQHEADCAIWLESDPPESACNCLRKSRRACLAMEPLP